MTGIFETLGRMVPAAALALAALPVSAQGTLDEVIAKAGEEGSVAFFASTTRFPGSAAGKIEDALKDKFGVDIDIEFVNGPPVPVMSGQIVTETAAGVAPSFDLFPLPLSFTKAIDEGGAIEDFDWAALGIDADLIDPEGNAVWIDTYPRTVTYNTKLLTGDDIPTKLEDLLDPKYKGRIVGPGFGDAYGMISVPVLGEEKAADWLKTLYDEQELTVISSMSDIPNRVANGEFAIGMGIPANRTGLVDKGAPIANAPLESVGGQPYYVFITKNAAHPNAGALLTYFFCCTDEGKKAMAENMGWARFDYPGSEQNDVGGDGRGQVPTAEWQLQHQARVARDFDKLIGR